MRPTPLNQPTTDATEPTDATDATEPTDATDATEPTDATDTTEPTDATDTTEPTDATDATDLTDATDATDPTDATDATDLTDATDATDLTDATDATDLTDATDATEPSDLVDASSPTEDERAPGTLTFSWLENYPIKLLRIVRSAQSDQFVSISSPNAQGDSFIFKHSFSDPQDRDSVTTTSITAEGAQLHDLVDWGSSLWLVGSVGETGVLWTLAEGQDGSELTPQVEAPYGIFIAITSFADELFLLERSPGNGAWIHRVFRFDSSSMVLEQLGPLTSPQWDAMIWPYSTTPTLKF